VVAAVPALETVIDAVHGVVSAIGSIGTVLKRDHTFEDDVEWLKVNGYLAASMDLWVISNGKTQPFEGNGVGEGYDVYPIFIRYWSIRTNDPDWQKAARIKARSVVDALADNPTVFGVSLFTGTGVSMDGPSPRQIRDRARSAGQMVYEAILSLNVEARRLS
jgi:hypothetical protein